MIGDASMTAGLALEGLHNAGHSGRNFTVVLNDNEMSIAESVGGLATYLAKLRVSPLYQSAEAQAKSLLKRVPGTPGRTGQQSRRLPAEAQPDAPRLLRSTPAFSSRSWASSTSARSTATTST